MATIASAKLNIVPDAGSGKAQVSVSCELHFTEEEVGIMKEKPELVYFQLFGWLMGQDPGSKESDDLIYTLPTWNFPDASPSLKEDVSFETELGNDLLNEDVLGTDEIYAELMLKGRFRFGQTIERTKTEVYRYDFG